MTSHLTILDWGLIDYLEAWQAQQALVQQRLDNAISDTLVLCEHPPVITLGRGTKPENILAPHIPVVEIERGGDVTYHGPGQLVAYPILMLPDGRRDLHGYLRDLETVLINTLAHFEIEGVRNEGYTGVWTQDVQTGQLKKLASIGVAVKRWVTYHGIALNVSTDLSAFQQINPCGLESTVMSSVSEQLKRPVSLDEIKPIFTNAFETVFSNPSA